MKKAFLLAPMVIISAGSAAAQGDEQSVIRQALCAPETLGENILYSIYLPAGYDDSDMSYPVLYVLHGRGDSMSALEELRGTLDTLITDNAIPPLIAVMPDAPWSDGGSYYIDSAFTGFPPGRPVETAFFNDFIP